MLSMEMILIIAVAIAGGGLSAIQLGKVIKARNERMKEDRARKEEMRNAQQKLDNEVLIKQMELDKKREDEEREEAARARREEEIRIRKDPEGYAPGEMMKTITDPLHAQAGRVAERADEHYGTLTSEIEALEKPLTLTPALANSLFVIWLITVATNIVMTGLVMYSIMGLWALIVAPALVLAPSAIMYWIRNAVDRRKRGTIQAEALLRIVVLGLAMLVVIGGILFSNAGARAGYLFDKKVSIGELTVAQLEEAEVPDKYEIAIQQKLLEELRASRQKAESLFKGILPISLALECLGAYFFTEFATRRRLKKLEAERVEDEMVRNSATDTQYEMEMITRNRVIARMVDLGLYNDGVLPQLGLNVESGEGEDVPARGLAVLGTNGSGEGPRQQEDDDVDFGGFRVEGEEGFPGDPPTPPDFPTGAGSTVTDFILD